MVDSRVEVGEDTPISELIEKLAFNSSLRPWLSQTLFAISQLSLSLVLLNLVSDSDQLLVLAILSILPHIPDQMKETRVRDNGVASKP